MRSPFLRRDQHERALQPIASHHLHIGSQQEQIFGCLEKQQNVRSLPLLLRFSSVFDVAYAGTLSILRAPKTYPKVEQKGSEEWRRLASTRV
jgi:hypothetical protein